jgi:hypothetical protein
LGCKRNTDQEDEEGGMTSSFALFLFCTKNHPIKKGMTRMESAEKTENKCLIIRGARSRHVSSLGLQVDQIKNKNGKCACNLNRIWKPLGGEVDD